MHRQAWIAWLLILLQAWMFWYFSETVFFPVMVVLFSLPAVLWRRRWELSSGYLPWIDLVVSGICTLKWNLAPYEPLTFTGFVMYPLMHAAAQFFLLAQVTRLWARRPDRPLPVYLPLLAVLVFICLGDVGLSRYGRRRWMFQNGTMVLAGLSCLYYSMARRRQEPPSEHARWVRPVISVGVLLTCAVTTRAGNTWLLSHWSDLEQVLMRASNSRGHQDRKNLFVGFSGQAPLGSVQLLRSAASNEIALRVVSEQAPGYLRGAAFDRFTSHGWEQQSDWGPLMLTRNPLSNGNRPPQPSPSPNTTRNQFVLRPTLTKETSSLTIWRSSTVERFSFLPLATSRLEATADVMYFDRHSVVSADNQQAGASLVAWIPRQAKFNPNEPIIQPNEWAPGQPLELSLQQTVVAQERLQQVPHRLAPQVIELARRLFADCPTPDEKIAAVQRHFATYQYDTSIQIPAERDPLAYFLLERPAAHCEYFASGTAILLRLGGIPCRYVTGYAGAEYNRIGQYWVVRQRDAHAWVEAHVPERGWMIVDTTPADSIPESTESGGLWRFWDDLNLRGQMIRAALAEESWEGKLHAAKLLMMSLVTTVPGWILIGGALFLVVRQFRFGRKAAQVLRMEPTLIELRRLLEELDQRLRRFDLERATYETLHQFSERLHTEAAAHPSLRAAADWYRRYATARYGSPHTPDGAASLRAELQTVCERLNDRLN